MLFQASTFESNEKQRAKWEQETGVPDTGLPIHEYVNLASKTDPYYVFTWKHEAVRYSLPMGTYVSHVMMSALHHNKHAPPRWGEAVPQTDFYFGVTQISFDTTKEYIPAHILDGAIIVIRMIAPPRTQIKMSLMRHYCRDQISRDIDDCQSYGYTTMLDTSGKEWTIRNKQIYPSDLHLPPLRLFAEEKLDIHE